MENLLIYFLKANGLIILFYLMLHLKSPRIPKISLFWILNIFKFLLFKNHSRYKPSKKLFSYCNLTWNLIKLGFTFQILSFFKAINVNQWSQLHKVIFQRYHIFKKFKHWFSSHYLKIYFDWETLWNIILKIKHD